MYEILPYLLGYTKDQIIEVISDNKDLRFDPELYEARFPDGTGVTIEVNIPGVYKGTPIQSLHLISGEKLEELYIDHRDDSIESLEQIDYEIEFPEWRVGDPCLFDYKMGYVHDMKDNRITGVSDGFGGTDSYDLSDRCFKINARRIIFTEDIYSIYRFIGNEEHKVPHEYIVNYPFIYGKLVNYWVALMNDDNSDYHEMKQFGNRILKAIEDQYWDLEFEERVFRERGSQVYIEDNENEQDSLFGLINKDLTI